MQFAAPRVTFFTIILFLIGIQSLCKEERQESPDAFIKPITRSVLLLLVAFDGFVGFVANRSLNFEVTQRLKIIQQEVELGSRNIIVPNYSTIPSRLTYMPTPKHDQEYLTGMAKNLGIDSIILNDDQSAPKPHSFQPLKGLKGKGL